MKAIKNNRFLSFCIVATALLCSCSKEPVESFAGGDPTSPILPDAGVVATVETKADLSGAVSGTAFPANTTKVFSVVGYKGTAAPTNNWSSPYINGVIVNSGASGVLSFATPQYYPTNSSEKVYFYAYSPASGTYTAGNGTTTPKVAWTINGTQDIMGAKVTTGIAKAATGTQSQPVFAFTHKLKQVKFKVVKDASFEDNIKLTSLKIIGAKTAATMDLSTGAVSWGSTTGDLNVYNNTTGQALTTTAASVGSAMMFEPGTSFKVRAIAGGVTYADATVTLSGTNAGQAGVSHEVTLKFMRNAIAPTATISSWTPITGPTADIEVEGEQDILYITDITLNSSSSHTVPRAGGTFTLIAQTNTTPTSNISWLVKTRDNYQVGSSTDYANFSTATINVEKCAVWGADIDLDLYWSYDGSPYRKYDGPYTLNQPAWTITSAKFTSGVYQNNDKVTHRLAGSRTLAITDYDPSGPAFYLRCAATNTTLGPFKSSNPKVTFVENLTGANLEYQIMAYDRNNALVDLGLSPLTQSKGSPIPSTSIQLSGNTYVYVDASLTTWYDGVYDYCTSRGMTMPTNTKRPNMDAVRTTYSSLDWAKGCFSATPWSSGFYYAIVPNGTSWKNEVESANQYKSHYRLCYFEF